MSDIYQEWENKIVYELNKREIMSVLVGIEELKDWTIKDIERLCDRKIIPKLQYEIDFERDIKRIIEKLKEGDRHE
jgi:hypothetical protein